MALGPAAAEMTWMTAPLGRQAPCFKLKVRQANVFDLSQNFLNAGD
jgi:hypothetical protein